MSMGRTVLLAAVAAFTLVQTSAEAQTRTPRDALVMAWNIDNILTMDPAQIGEALTDEIVNNVCDQLISFDPGDSNKQLPGLADHTVIPTSHSGMLFSPEVARLAVEFFRTGHFDTHAPIGV